LKCTKELIQEELVIPPWIENPLIENQSSGLSVEDLVEVMQMKRNPQNTIRFVLQQRINFICFLKINSFIRQLLFVF
jgi:hypothetical protein